MFLGLFLGLGQVNQALGPVSNNRSANVVGVGGTGTSGSIKFITAGVVGVGATASIGSITVTSSDRHANVTGVSATGSAGSVAANTDAVQTTAFLARTSGLSGTETAAYKALINGLVSDGTFTLLDALYIFATNTTTTANLNLVSTSFTLTPTGGLGFAADVGYTGNGSGAFLDTGLITGTNFTQNSSSLGMAVQTDDRSSVTQLEMGASDASNSVLGSNFSLSSIYAVHESSFNFPASTTSKGMWAVSRTGSTTESLYKNGSSIAVDSVATTASAVNTGSIYILGRNTGGSVSNATSRQLSAAWIGGGLTGSQFASISNRINTYLASMTTPVNVY